MYSLLCLFALSSKGQKLYDVKLLLPLPSGSTLSAYTPYMQHSTKKLAHCVAVKLAILKSSLPAVSDNRLGSSCTQVNLRGYSYRFHGWLEKSL